MSGVSCGLQTHSLETIWNSRIGVGDGTLGSHVGMAVVVGTVGLSVTVDVDANRVRVGEGEAGTRVTLAVTVGVHDGAQVDDGNTAVSADRRGVTVTE